MTEENIFTEAIAIADHQARSAFLDEACAGDTEMRQRLLELLRAHTEAGAFLEVPAWQQGTSEHGGDSTDQTEAFGAARAEALPALDFLAPSTQPDSMGRLGQYEVRRLLGAGGMGLVLEATDSLLGRRVALKVMRPELASKPGHRERFLREAKAAAALEHDHVVPIFQVGDDRGIPFIAMPFLKGASLEERLRALEKTGARLPVADILQIARQTAEGLAAAHAQGLIHRDIKPANIWIETRLAAPLGGAWPERLPEGFRVKILDFGLARLATGEQNITQSGVVLGTPAYMSPEQARHEDLDGRADLFSLGVVLYRMTTRTLPFAGKDPMSTLLALATHQPTPPAAANNDIPPKLSELIMKLLEKDAARRPASAAEVLRMIDAIQDTIIDAPPTRTGAQAPVRPDETIATAPLAVALDAPLTTATTAPAPPRRRRPLVVAVLCLALVPLAYFFGGTALRFITNKGELIIDVQDDSVEVVIRRDGLVVVDKSAKREFTLTAGDGEIEVVEKEGVKLLTRKFELSRGGKTTVTVTLGELADARRPRPTPVDDAWLKHVASLPLDKQVDAVAAKLKELNSGFDGKMSYTTNAGEVNSLRLLTDEVTDISPLRALTGLTQLDCSGSQEKEWLGRGKLTDLRPLKGLKLSLLTCNFTRVSNLSALKDMNLENLVLRATQVTDLSPLADQRKLRELDISFTPVTDLSPLKDLPLETLRCRGSKVADLKSLEALPLQVLQVEWTRVSDLTPLRRIGSLWSFYCDHTEVADLSPLKGLPNLGVVQCTSTKISDLSPLAGLKLTTLIFEDTQIADLAPLKGMKLSTLHLRDTKVSDLAILRGMPLKILMADDATLARNAETLRDITTLEKVNGLSAADFWKKMDAKGGSGVSPFDLLDPAAIPAAERFPFQPKELVAVLGAHAGRHWGAVDALALSPDGKWLASAGNDGAIRIWDAATLEEKRVLRGHIMNVTDLAFSPKANLLASTAIEPDKSIRLWNLDEAEPKGEILLQRGAGFLSVAWSPDGKVLAAGARFGRGEEITLWNVTGPAAKLRGSFPAPEAGGHVYALAFFPDSKTLALGALTGALSVWDISGVKPAQKATVKAHKEDLRRLAISKDGKYVATSEASGDRIVWQWTGETLKKESLHHFEDYLSPVPFDDAGEALYESGPDGIYRLDWKSGKREQVVRSTYTEFRRLIRFPDGKRFAGAGVHGVYLFERKDKDFERTMRESSAAVWSVAVSPDGAFIAAATQQSAVKVWRLDKGKASVVLSVPDWCDRSTIAFSPDGRFLAATRRDGVCKLWRRKGEGFEGPLTLGHDDNLTALAFAPSSDLLAVAGDKGVIYLWTGLDTPKPKQLATCTVGGQVWSLAFSIDGKLLAAGSRGKGETVTVWQLDGKETRKLHSVPGCTTTFVRGGELFAGGYDVNPFLWDISQPKAVSRPLTNATAYAVAAGKKRSIVASVGSPSLSIDDTVAGKRLRSWALPPTSSAVALSPDERHVVIGNENGTIYILRLEPAPTPVDDAWLKRVAALPAEKQVEAVIAKLKELNPGFDGKASHRIEKIEKDVVTEFRFRTDEAPDISPVRALTGLRTLDCGGSEVEDKYLGKLVDLTPLRGLKLAHLFCANTLVSDLSPLSDMELQLLNLSTTPVHDLSPLKRMRSLKLLFLTRTRIESLEMLKELDLHNLMLSHTKVADLSPLKGMDLQQLHLGWCPVSDLSPLKDMTSLRDLACTGTRIADLSALTRLVNLEIFGCDFTAIRDLAPLRGMKLRDLNLIETKVSDLAPLRGMPLRRLFFHRTAVRDLTPLRGMPLEAVSLVEFVPARDADILRSIATLKTINNLPADEFCKNVEDKAAPMAPRSFIGHKKTVGALALVDGQSFLAGSDGELWLWDTKTAEVQRRFEGVKGWVRAVAIHPDRLHGLSGGADGIARLWLLKTGKEIGRAGDGKAEITAVAFSPDRRHFLYAADDVVYLCDFDTRKEVKRFSGRCAAFSRDGSRLLTARNQTLYLWDAKTGDEVKRFTGATNHILCVALSPDGRWVASGGPDAAVRIWDVDKGTRLHLCKGHAGSVHSIAISPDSRLVLSGAGDKTARLWDIATGAERFVSSEHAGPVTAALFASEGRQCLTGGGDGLIRLWNVPK